MLAIMQIFITLLFVKIFYDAEHPKIRYLFYGYLFFFIALTIQLPFRYLELTLKEMFEFTLMSQVVIAPFLLIATEVTKYFSMKKFIRTRNFKNAIFFGMGWISIESINFFSATFFSLIFSFIGIQFDYSLLLNPNYSYFNFLFFFIINLAITIFVIKSIISKKIYYLFYAIAFSIIVYYGLLLMEGFDKYMFSLASLLFSTIVIFYYKIFK